MNNKCLSPFLSIQVLHIYVNRPLSEKSELKVLSPFSNRDIGCILMQVRRCIHNNDRSVTLIYHGVLWMLSACSLLSLECGVSVGVKVFTEQLWAVVNSCSAALISVLGDYLRMICRRNKRQQLSGCIQLKHV